MHSDAVNPFKRSLGTMASQLENTALNADSNAISTSSVTAANGVGDENVVSINPKDFNPRSYQRKVYEVAMKRNIIAVLETGAGKTMIAVMLMKDIGQAIAFAGDRKLIIFLAPTVHLVNQQFEVIKIHTNFQVGEYYGAKGVDEWNLKSWEKEIKEHDVLVMTPQILLDALRKAFLNLETVCLVIIDECHRATGNHPYAKIMKEFYHKSTNKPKIFGMTASPVIRKGVSSLDDCEDQLSELESILDSQIYTIENRTELDMFVPSAKGHTFFYNANLFSNLDLKNKLDGSRSKFDALLMEVQGSVASQYKDMDDRLKMLRKRLSNDHTKILYCLDDLGLLCAYEAAKICIENVRSDELHAEDSLQCKYYLNEALSVIAESLPHGSEVHLDAEFDYLKAVEMGYLSPKLHALIQVFRTFGEVRKVMCLIFVDRIITAKVIERIIKAVTCLSHFSVSYLTGSNSSVDSLAPKMQKETLESFRSGKVNLLFATDVVEEGIHVPQCSCVIRFDLPKTVRSYVQSRGRARQHDSQFIMMIERGNQKQLDQLFDIIRSERSMTDTSTNRDPDTCLLKAYTVKEADTYFVETTGASVTVDSSVSLIHRYCEKLPGDKYFIPRPIFQLLLVEDSYQCKLSLPPNAAFQTIVGPQNRNSHRSKQLVCLEACKRLHQMGALDDHLLPAMEEPQENDAIVKCRETLGAGTTKRKELHGTTSVGALSGTWGYKSDDVIFQAYRLKFSCSISDEEYSGFVLLVESKLDDDVGNVEFKLHLVNKFVNASVSESGLIRLASREIDKAKHFQELFFNGLFGRLFSRSKSSAKPREFLLEKEKTSLWSSSNMYLLLPLKSSDASSSESYIIDWVAIHSCANVVEFLKKNVTVGQKHSCSEDSSQNGANTEMKKYQNENVIHCANNFLHNEKLKEKVVIAIHTGRIYLVLDVLIDTSSQSPFDGNADKVSSSYTTFTSYFKQKYGIELLYPEQPLLLLKQSHNAHNLLTDFNEVASHGKMLKSDQKMTPEKPRNHVHMPPELLVTTDVPKEVLRSFYLLPSVMHRLESLMLASQLRKEIARGSCDIYIPSSLILEALTSLRCCENYSMERLELLGDSVLKYSVSCFLFLKYPKKHEGQLSTRRSWAVCNSTLHKLGTDRKLQGYIRDSPFDPRRWLAPGQRPTRLVPCSCGVDGSEVPLGEKFQTEEAKIVVGKLCDKGHRWLCSKTISDCVEALIGAYYVGGGLTAALYFMKWLGIDADLDPSLVVEATNSASLHSCIPKANDIESLESKLGYQFIVKGLLLEAMTHPSGQELGVNYCYQRLEFLGDSVLDLLITWHLYQEHVDIDPGELTDLRSASVNNENFSQVAVRHNLQQHLQHCSGLLLTQITDYVKSLSDSDTTTRLLQGIKGPKALGDLVESIAGAILIDTNLELGQVWKIFKPLLSPIVTPDKLELPPWRELNELCDSMGLFIKENCSSKGEVVQAELTLQLKDVLLIGQGSGRNRKSAKGQAALQLLKDLEDRGISRLASKKRKQGWDSVAATLDIDNQACDENGLEPSPQKKQKTTQSELYAEPTEGNGASEKVCGSKPGNPVVAAINMNKGGPRTTLYELCRKLQWPMPDFDSTEKTTGTPITIGKDPERKKGFKSFASKITMHIPNHGKVVLTGEHRADKKSSFDSAALLMLYELQRLGKLTIADP